MIIRLTADKAIELEDPGNFRKFDIRVDQPRDRLATVTAHFAGLAVFESADQAWVDAAALRRLAPADPAWAAAFDAMVEKARPHGWIRDTPLRVAAHVVWEGQAS